MGKLQYIVRQMSSSHFGCTLASPRFSAPNELPFGKSSQVEYTVNSRYNDPRYNDFFFFDITDSILRSRPSAEQNVKALCVDITILFVQSNHFHLIIFI